MSFLALLELARVGFVHLLAHPVHGGIRIFLAPDADFERIQKLEGEIGYD